jgi:O-antigen/teichoic acid export membrane protein
MSGQISQAIASFALQVTAARTMGAAGLGIFSVLYGAIVIGTAVSTGMVGDSLTVLNRKDLAIRAALSRWCLILSALAGVLGMSFGLLTGELTVSAAILYGAATFTFIAEDAFRRMLMATMRFWSLPFVDGTSLVVSMLLLLGVHLAGYRLTIGLFMLALLAGQSAASVLAYFRLPHDERSLSPRGSAAMRAVFSYGAWRSVQLCVRPGTLTAARIIITLLVGVTAYGKLEAARVYMAPALLLVAGMGSFLLPMYVAQRHEPLRFSLRRADKATIGLLTSTLVLGVVGTLCAPILGPVITDGRYQLAPIAVMGWVVYAATGAALLPYTGLAAVRGRQSNLTAIRALEPTLSLALVVPATLIAVSAAPYAIGVGSFLAMIAVRRWVLRPLLRDDAVSRAGAGSADAVLSSRPVATAAPPPLERRPVASGRPVPRHAYRPESDANALRRLLPRG